MATKVFESSLVIAAQDKTASAIGKVVKNIDSAIKSVDQFRAANEKFAAVRGKLNAAQKAVEGAAQAMSAAAKPTKALAASYRQAQEAVSAASRAFDHQKSVVLGAKHALEGHGVAVGRLAAEQDRLRRSAEHANAALQRQQAIETRRAGRRQALGTVAGGAGLIAAIEGKRLAEATVETYRDFDKNRRALMAFGGLTSQQAEPLVSQAIHGGATSKYNDIQWLEAQKDLIARGLTVESTRAVAQTAVGPGQAFGITLPEAAKLLEGAVFGLGKDTSSYAATDAGARRSADLMVRAAKLTGMNAEDIGQAYKYAANVARMSGISEERMLAFMGLGKKANIGGDEMGVAFRTLAARVVSPTQKGKEALAAHGINYSSFQHMPASLSVGNFASSIAQGYGVKLDAGARAELQKAFSNPAVFGNAGAFNTAVVDALRGQTGIKDAKGLAQVAKSAERFRQFNVEKVDAPALIAAIMGSIHGGNLALSNAVFGEKQGGRIATALRDEDLYNHLVEKLEQTQEGFATEISNKMMSGFDGAMSRFEGSVKNLETALGRAWDKGENGGALTGATNVVGGLIQRYAELDGVLVGVTSGFAALAVGAPAAAAALMWAAKLLGVPTTINAVTPLAAAWRWGTAAVTAGFGVPAAILGLTGLTLYEATKDYEGKTIRERLDEQRGGSLTEFRRRQFNEERGQLGIDSKIDISLNTNLLRAEVRSIVRDENRELSRSSGTTGSLGKSMAEAGPDRDAFDWRNWR